MAKEWIGIIKIVHNHLKGDVYALFNNYVKESYCLGVKDAHSVSSEDSQA